jgi:hypothetical protein
MKVLSSRLRKAALMTAILVVSSVASADCNSNCSAIARQYAEQARASVLTKLSTCDQYASDPTAYNNCTAPIYAEADAKYKYVYNEAYSGCLRSCPL